MKRYPSLKPGIWGAVIGAAAISVVGFSSFGWTLGSTAERMAKEQAQNAVVAVLAPICVEKFQHQTDAATKLVEFKKVSSSWDRRSFIEKGGWATTAGDNGGNRCPKHGGCYRLRRTTRRPSLGGGSLITAPASHLRPERLWRCPLDFPCSIPI
jgi:hypothetical protein